MLFGLNRATGRKSNESIEVHPLHHTSSLAKNPKGVLRRMPRVRSDEIHAEIEGNHCDQHQEISTVKEKTPSPIGAGLPLLQRLRLLKEKQVSPTFILETGSSTVLED